MKGAVHSPWGARIVRGARIVAILAILSTCAGCWATDVDPPPGAAPLRYRDQIFGDVTVDRDLQYGLAPGVDGYPVALRLDLYRPTGDTAVVRPAVVLVHGGGFLTGDKVTGPATDLARSLAERGYVTVSINYRLLAPQSCSGADGVSNECSTAAIAGIHDAQAAVRWLRANALTYGIDPTRIGIEGVSAGGIIATGTGLWADEPGGSGNPDWPSDVEAWVSVSGGLPDGLFVDSGDAPGYLFSGTQDDVVPYQWSVDTATKMSDAGVPVAFKTFVGAGHVPVAEYGDVIQDQSVNHFYRYLVDPPPGS